MIVTGKGKKGRDVVVRLKKPPVRQFSNRIAGAALLCLYLKGMTLTKQSQIVAPLLDQPLVRIAGINVAVSKNQHGVDALAEVLEKITIYLFDYGLVGAEAFSWPPLNKQTRLMEGMRPNILPAFKSRPLLNDYVKDAEDLVEHGFIVIQLEDGRWPNEKVIDQEELTYDELFDDYVIQDECFYSVLQTWFE